MQVFRNEFLAAPTNFFALASLRQAVRLACFAAASPEEDAAGVAGVGFAAGAAGSSLGAEGAAPNPPATGNTVRYTAATARMATVEKRLRQAVMVPG